MAKARIKNLIDQLWKQLVGILLGGNLFLGFRNFPDTVRYNDLAEHGDWLIFLVKLIFTLIGNPNAPGRYFTHSRHIKYSIVSVTGNTGTLLYSILVPEILIKLPNRIY